VGLCKIMCCLLLYESSSGPAGQRLLYSWSSGDKAKIFLSLCARQLLEIDHRPSESRAAYFSAAPVPFSR
jgi:hypothetical protein